MAAGPLLGGALVALANWRAVFAVNVVIGIPAAVWSLRSMPAIARRSRRIDVAGMGTATILIGGLVFALIEAPAQSWLSPAVITAGALVVAGLVGFVCAEREPCTSRRKGEGTPVERCRTPPITHVASIRTGQGASPRQSEQPHRRYGGCTVVQVEGDIVGQ